MGSILISIIDQQPQVIISICSLLCYVSMSASRTKKEGGDDITLSFIIGWIYISYGFYILIQISKIYYHTIMLMFIVWICDTGALLIGRYFGTSSIRNMN